MITAAQLRAARGLLDWTRSDLAKASGLSPETIKNIEHGTFKPQDSTLESITKTFSTHNVEFTSNEGVRICKEFIANYNGPENFRSFFDDVYNTVKDKEKALICISGVDEALFQLYLGDYHTVHVERMAKLKNISVKCLLKEGDTNFVCNEYCDYRWVPDAYFRSVPFYVYGDKLAIIIFHGAEDVRVAVVNSPLVGAAYREQFEMIWRDAIVPLGTGI